MTRREATPCGSLEEIALYLSSSDARSLFIVGLGDPIGRYQVMAVHRSVNPAQAQQTVQINSQTVVMGVRFIYSEPEQQLLRVGVREFRVDE